MFAPPKLTVKAVYGKLKEIASMSGSAVSLESVWDYVWIVCMYESFWTTFAFSPIVNVQESRHHQGIDCGMQEIWSKVSHQVKNTWSQHLECTHGNEYKLFLGPLEESFVLDWPSNQFSLLLDML